MSHEWRQEWSELNHEKPCTCHLICYYNIIQKRHVTHTLGVCVGLTDAQPCTLKIYAPETHSMIAEIEYIIFIRCLCLMYTIHILNTCARGKWFLCETIQHHFVYWKHRKTGSSKWDDDNSNNEEKKKMKRKIWKHRNWFRCQTIACYFVLSISFSSRHYRKQFHILILSCVASIINASD